MAWNERQTPGDRCDPSAFLPRRQFALYLDDTLAEAIAASEGLVSLLHLRAQAVGVRRTSPGRLDRDQ